MDWELGLPAGLLAKIAGADACRDSRMPLSGTLCVVNRGVRYR
jgi:hypothetical protein